MLRGRGKEKDGTVEVWDTGYVLAAFLCCQRQHQGTWWHVSIGQKTGLVLLAVVHWPAFLAPRSLQRSLQTV